MIRNFLATALLGFVATSSLSAAAPKDGKWLLTNVTAIGDSTIAIIKWETKDGAQTAEVLFTPFRSAPLAKAKTDPPKAEIKNFKATEKEVSFVLKVLGNEVSFEGAPSKSDENLILGSYGRGNTFSRAKLTVTDKDSLDSKELLIRRTQNESFSKARQIQTRAANLQFQIRQEKDGEKRKALIEQLPAAKKAADEEVFPLFRKVVTDSPTSPEAYDTALVLLRAATKAKLTPKDAAELVQVVETQATPHGQRLLKTVRLQIAEALVNTKELGPIALKLIEPISKELKGTETPADQIQVLTTYRTALDLSGRSADAKKIDERLGVLEGQLDKEYLATHPPFKPTPYAGRKDKDANRVVVMELFTGAQCPPCVAADLGFDGLNKSYQPTDLVLLQYHQHIPGPDPLTNADTIARWNYYREKAPEGVRGTPTTIFNGKVAAAGGGGLANSEKKYTQYREIIDAALAEKTPINVKGSVIKSGDKIDIGVKVDGATPDANLKLRFVLVEEDVKYVGGNGLRFHHQVVRALPGGAAGTEIKTASFEHKVTADLAEIRKGITKYLDEFSAERETTFKSRPLDLKHLKVIALVQDDKTGEILQATQFDVGDKAASR